MRKRDKETSTERTVCEYQVSKPKSYKNTVKLKYYKPSSQKLGSGEWEGVEELFSLGVSSEIISPLCLKLG